MTFTIRRAAPEDAAGITTIIRELGWFPEMAAESVEQTTARVAATLAVSVALSDDIVFVAVLESGEIGGFAALHILPYFIRKGNDGYVSELFVRATQRGQGIGSALLDAVIAEARQQGCFRLRLINVQTRESYQRRFYEKHGWVEWRDAATFVYRLK